MADPRYPIVMIGGVPVVDAPQEIDAANAESFQKILQHAASCGPAAVVVNMAGTRFCDSAGVAVLAWAQGLAVAKAGKLLLVIPADATVLRVLAFAGIDRLILHFADLNEALGQAHAVVPRPLQRHTMHPQTLAYRMSNPSGSCGGRYQRDWQPSAQQYTTVCPVGPPASSTGGQLQFSQLTSTRSGPHSWPCSRTCFQSLNKETDEQPQLYFSHQFRVGNAYTLAAQVRRGLEQMDVVIH